MSAVILVAHANDRQDEEQYLRNLPREMKGIRAALKPARKAGLCKPVERSNATVEEVFDVFREHRDKVAIFHFAGHTSSSQLFFESVDGAPQEIRASGLAAYLSEQSGLKLVFINGCESEDQVDDLIAAGVPAVIATSATIDDVVATTFAVHFYKGLASNASIQTAFNEAEAAIKSTMSPAETFNHDHEEYSGDDEWPWRIYESPKTFGLAQRWKLTTAEGSTSNNATGRKIKIPELLPYMADRSRQRDQLADAIFEHKESHNRRPFVTVVSGDEREAHKAFVERLQMWTLPKLLKLREDSEPIHLFSIDWGDPQGSVTDRFEHLKKRLSQQLTGNRMSTPHDLVAALAKHRCPVMLSSSIYSQHWQQHEPELIHEFTRFWQEWPDLPQGQPLFVVLNFVLKDYSKESFLSRLRIRKRNKAVLGFLEKYSSGDANNVSLTVLDPLRSINEEHVRRWIENEAGDFFQNTGGQHGGVELSEAMMEWVAERFRQSREETGESGIPMMVLARELREKLNRHITEGGV